MSSAPLIFLDTETTGLHADRRPWEIGMIRRDDTGERRMTLVVQDVDLTTAEPMGLKVGRFYDRHPRFNGEGLSAYGGDVHLVYEAEAEVTHRVEEWTRGAHMVGAVPNFDAETLAAMFARHRLIPAWHYHLVDVENLAVGWLASNRDLPTPEPPWDSNELSRNVGVNPDDFARHTALGDARWARAIYDAVMGESA